MYIFCIKHVYAIRCISNAIKLTLYWDNFTTHVFTLAVLTFISFFFCYWWYKYVQCAGTCYLWSWNSGFPNSVLPFKGLILIRCSIIVILNGLKIIYEEFSDMLKNNSRAIYSTVNEDPVFSAPSPGPNCNAVLNRCLG